MFSLSCCSATCEIETWALFSAPPHRSLLPSHCPRGSALWGSCWYQLSEARFSRKWSPSKQLLEKYFIGERNPREAETREKGMGRRRNGLPTDVQSLRVFSSMAEGVGGARCRRDARRGQTSHRKSARAPPQWSPQWGSVSTWPTVSGTDETNRARGMCEARHGNQEGTGRCFRTGP